MASVEALGALLAGPADWDAYRKTQGAAEIDLTLGDFQGSDLQGRVISGCDLTGSDFTGANLDGAQLSDSRMNGACFDSASFVGCSFNGLQATGASFRSCIFRDTVVSSVRLAEADFSRSRFTHATINSSQLHRSVLDLAELRDLVLTGTNLSGVRGSQSRVVKCRLDNCDIIACEFELGHFAETEFHVCGMRDASYKSGTFTDCGLIQCNLRNVEFQAACVERCDFSGSRLADIDLRTIDLASASLLKTAFVACEWPEMKGSVTIIGGYRPSPYLPRQPVQDIDGVPPMLRRDIADAQYIMALLGTAKSPLRRLVLRIWGLTSGYGQDLTRLVAVTAIIIVIHALLYLAFQGQLFGWHAPNVRLLASAVGNFALSSLGITPASEPPGAAAALITSMRVFGFIIFGIWISIAANKVSKLGSQ